MKWFILAGGQGERLFPFSTIVPKPLIPVGGVPCVRWIVEQLIDEHQYEDTIVLCINKWAERHFRHEFRDLPHIQFSVSESPLGTAGELLTARRHINDAFGVIYGDDLSVTQYNMLIDAHNATVLKPSATLALTRNTQLDVGVVETNDVGMVTQFTEKPPLNSLVWTGVVIFEPEVMCYLKIGGDIARDVFPLMLYNNLTLRAFISEEEWLDVGNINALRKADRVFATRSLPHDRQSL